MNWTTSHKTNELPKRLRVGIWCAYHVTLEQSEGIGVFAHNLARGLASLGDSVSVTMTAKMGDERLMSETLAAGNGRIQVMCPSKQNFLQELTGSVFREIARGATRIARKSESKYLAYSAVASAQRSLAGHLKRFAWKRLMRFGSSTASVFARIGTSRDKHVDKQWEQIIDTCDVWLLPYVGLDRHFKKPTVVTVHDLVCYHFPEVLSPPQLAIFKNLAETVSSQAAVVACMSEFIRENDLLGVLGLPAEKVRVVQPAAPSDFGGLGDLERAHADYPILKEQYLFYPSAFRAYKNHELLVAAVGTLRQKGNKQLKLVFTGIHSAPPELHRLIRDWEVEEQVHILGKVPREVLALLYQQALATIVPSRYEQGSFPLMEALHWGCPIACSRIPSLTELLHKLGNDMRYFSPDSVDELVEVIQEFIRDRPGNLARQQARKSQILGRTWAEAAVDWRRVLETAIERHQLQWHDETAELASRDAA